MREKLEALGWIKYHECNTCSGHRMFFNKADKPGYEVRIKIRNNTFSILLRNVIIAGPYWGYELEQKLLEHVPV
jgi:hypothetical protein